MTGGVARPLPPHPGRRQAADRVEDRAVLAVGAGQVAGAHEELADDFAAGELEGLAEQLHPGRLVLRVVGVDPAREGAEVAPQGDDAPGVLDGGIDLRSEEHTSELQSLMRTSYA